MDLSMTKTVLRSLLISSPKTLTVNELDIDYLKLEGQRIPFNRLGYPNLKKFLLSIPDVLTISYFDEVVPVTANSQSEHIHKYVTESSSANTNRFNIRYGYQRSHPRIKLEYSPRNNFNRSDDLNIKMGQLKLKPHEETTGCNKKNEDPKTLTIESDEKEEVDEESKEVDEVALASRYDEGLGKPVSNDEVSKATVPILIKEDPTLPLGLPLLSTEIPNANLTELKPGRSYNVFVTEINRPWRFWFCLCDKKGEDEIEEQLMWYFNDEKFKVKALARSEMVAGSACLISYKNKVWRAEFMEAPTVKDKIKVRFVDYGTIATVDITECRRINKYFASIPKRCFPGALDLIEPIESSDKQLIVVERFCKMVHDKPLVGFVTKIDQTNNVIRMILIDTSDEQKDVIVNQKLLDAL